MTSNPHPPAEGELRNPGMPLLIGVQRVDGPALVRLLNEFVAIKGAVGQSEDNEVLHRVLANAITACRFNRVHLPGYEWLDEAEKRLSEVEYAEGETT